MGYGTHTGQINVFYISDKLTYYNKQRKHDPTQCIHAASMRDNGNPILKAI